MALNHSSIGIAAWTDLLRLLRDERPRDFRGTPRQKRIGAESYWYDRYRIGADIIDRYVGPEGDALRTRVERFRKEADGRKSRERERARLMRILRAENFAMTDARSGPLLAAMARAGVFDSGGTLLGNAAFALYEGELGIRLGAISLRPATKLPVHAPTRLEIALEDPASEGIEAAFSELEFEPVDVRGKSWRWRQSHQQTFAEFVTPGEDGKQALRDMPALGVRARCQPLLAFLLTGSIQVPLLYRAGALVRVPRPERFAFHKLLTMGRAAARGKVSSETDRFQTSTLIEILSDERPHELAEAHAAARGLAEASRTALEDALDLMPATRANLEAIP